MGNNLVLVEGEVIVKDGTGSTIEFYEEEFVIDGSIDTIPMARSLIKKGLIGERLRKKVPGYRAVRTCQVISLSPTEQEAKQSELDLAFLKAIQLGCVPENIDSYKRPDYKLKALEKAIDLAIKRRKDTRKRNNKELEIQDMGYVND